MLGLYLQSFGREEDKRKFEEVYTKYEYLVVKTAGDYLVDKSLRLDCLQDTFLRLVDNFETFNTLPEYKQKRYLVTICKRCAICINNVTCVANIEPLEMISGEDEYKIATFDNSKYDIAEIVSAIRSLDEKYQVPIIMKYVDGYSAKEIADTLSVSENLVLQRLYRGKQMICSMLCGEEF